MYIIVGICCVICGLFMLIDPWNMWQNTERWKALGGFSQSRFFRPVMRLSGAVLALLGMLSALGVLR